MPPINHCGSSICDIIDRFYGSVIDAIINVVKRVDAIKDTESVPYQNTVRRKL